MRKPTIRFALAILFLCSAMDAHQSPSANYDETRAGTYTLPDPLTFNNGRPVRNVKDWKRRRPEILQLFANDVYGRNPQSPRALRYEVFDTDEHALNGLAVRKQVTIYFSDKKDGPKEDVLLYIPAASKKPVPVILTLNLFGNQSVINDPGVKLGTIWTGKTHERQQAGKDSRGRYKGFEVEKILSHGYGFATICYGDIEPDFNGGIAYGIRPLFFGSGQSQPKSDEWGAIGAWSYGLSRAMDYLEKEKAVDPHRVAIMGHSRLGKTVLWAGAMDQRFAMVLASCSGEAGASLARRNYGETVQDLVNTFPYWFCINFQKYAKNVSQLPVDMHELIALLAPRPVYITGAEEDRWADPKGEFLACVGAGPVYRLLGVQGLGTDQMPPLNQPIMHTIGYHYRTGKHEVTAFDWDQFLKFADMHLQVRQ